jgi:hypothetical protein
MPGIPLSNATKLDLTTAIQPIDGSIGGSKLEEYYQVTLSKSSSLTLSLTNLSTQANLTLIEDSDDDGQFDLSSNDLGLSEILNTSRNFNGVSQSINTLLDPGTYYIRISVDTPLDTTPAPTTPYTLKVSSTRTFAPRDPFSGLLNDMKGLQEGLPDFNGDKNADLLVTNLVTDQQRIWIMNAGQVSNNTYLLSADFNWQDWSIELSKDFDGDGKTDLLLQNPSLDQKAIWLMNGTQVVKGDYLLNYVWKDGWEIEATGDFNGDGKTDLLLDNPSSLRKAIWIMNGTQVASGDYLLDSVWKDGWEIEASADFNGDGKADLLLKNASLQRKAIWLMNGTQIVSGEYLLDPVWKEGWEIEAKGDFNGDGKTDLLLKNASLLKQAIWIMNGLQVAQGDYLLDYVWKEGWEIEATGDFDGDRKTDLLLNNYIQDRKAIWIMNGTAIRSGDYLLDPVWKEGWTIDAMADLNGDGTKDFFLGNTKLGQQAVWLMKGTVIDRGTYVDFPAGTQAAFYDMPDLELGKLAGNTSATAFGIGDLTGNGGTFEDGIAPNTSDWYQFTLTETNTVSVSVKKIGEDLDILVNLRNAAQQVQASEEEEDNLLYRLQPGTYYVQLSTLTGRGTYTLTLEGNANLRPGVDLNGAASGLDTRVQLNQGTTNVSVAPQLVLSSSSNLLRADITLVNSEDGTLESLSVDTTGTSIVATYADGELALTGAASVTDYQKVLQTLTYRNTAATPNPQDRLITVSVSDGIFSSAVAEATVAFWNAVVDTTPSIDLNGAAMGIDTTATFAVGGQPVVLAPGAVIPGATSLVKAVVWIDNPVNAPNEVLAVDTTGTTLQAEFFEDGQLLITGMGSAADYQKVLRTLTYRNTMTAADLDPRTRSILIALDDGEDYSDAAEVKLSFSLS